MHLKRAVLTLVFFFSLGCAHFKSDSKYPEAWFAPVLESTKASWEVLPQEAKPGEVILSKRNELGLLSNFASTPFEYHGVKYPSVEGFWQMMLYPENNSDPRMKLAKKYKVEWQFTREQVSKMVAFEAKKAGSLAEANMKKMNIDWATFEGQKFVYRELKPGKHYQLIWDAMWAKLNQNAKVKEVLLKTGDLVLRPDHHSEENAPPEWYYFDIWMKMRSILQAGAL